MELEFGEAQAHTGIQHQLLPGRIVGTDSDGTDGGLYSLPAKPDICVAGSIAGMPTFPRRVTWRSKSYCTPNRVLTGSFQVIVPHQLCPRNGNPRHRRTRTQIRRFRIKAQRTNPIRPHDASVCLNVSPHHLPDVRHAHVLHSRGETWALHQHQRPTWPLRDWRIFGPDPTNHTGAAVLSKYSSSPPKSVSP